MAIDVPAVRAAIRILEQLAAELPEPVHPAALIDELDLNRSTCYNILSTLQRMGWAKNFGNRGGWTLGPRLLTLTGVSQEITLSVVQQEIDTLSRRLGVVVFVADHVESSGYTVIAKAEQVSGIRISVSIGDHFPFGAPALMLAFESACSDEDFVRRYRRNGATAFTSMTTTDPDKLVARLAEVRDVGYSVSLREFAMSQGAAAAPVFDTQGRVRMALCALGFYTDINEETVPKIGPMVRACADRITHRTGGILPDDAATHAELA